MNRRVLLFLSAAFVAVAGALFFWQREKVYQSAQSQIVEPRQVTSNTQENRLLAAAISPDGQSLAFADREGLHLRRLDDGQTKSVPLPRGFSGSVWCLSWFPEGTRLAACLSMQDGDKSAIWMMPLGSGVPKKLYEDGWGAAVSPEGTRIAFISGTAVMGGSQIVVVDINGANARVLVKAEAGDSLQAVAWSPVSQRIAVQRWLGATNMSLARIESYSADGSDKKPILEDARLTVPRMGPGALAWTADNRVIFTLREEPPAEAYSNLWAMRVDPQTGRAQGPPARLTKLERVHVPFVSVSPDGKRMALLGLRKVRGIFLSALDAGGAKLREPRRLGSAESNDTPDAWTADSRAILFSSDRNGSLDIFKRDITKANDTALAGGSEEESRARLSPDGAWVYYLSKNKEQALGRPIFLMRVPLAGGKPVQAAAIPYYRYHDMRCPRRAGSACVVSEQVNEQLFFSTLDPGQGLGKELARMDMNASWHYPWDISPDGERSAVAIDEAGKGRIRLVTLANGTSREIAIKDWGGLGHVSWSAAGDRLFVVSWGQKGSAILQIDLDGRARVLYRSPTEWLGALTPSPDGKYLAFARETTGANMWLLENF